MSLTNPLTGVRDGSMLEVVMQKIDGFYLYKVGFVLHPLSELKQDDTWEDWMFDLYFAAQTLDQFLHQSVYRFRTCSESGEKLLKEIKSILERKPEKMAFAEYYGITNTLREFESVLNAELRQMDVYLVLKKRGYDTNDLIDFGIRLFPPDLATKVPECVVDINSATRCIAFSLPTAAAFHLHRANESVLHKYYDNVTNGAQRPKGRNIGEYINALNEYADPVVLSSLRDLKDIHRNPLIHPEHTLDNIDQAIGLMGSIQAVMIHMLAKIPDNLVLTTPN